MVAAWGVREVGWTAATREVAARAAVVKVAAWGVRVAVGLMAVDRNADSVLEKPHQYSCG